MRQVIIENLILNSPYSEPTRHFHFTDEGITSEIDEGAASARISSPSHTPKKKNPKQIDDSFGLQTATYVVSRGPGCMPVV